MQSWKMLLEQDPSLLDSLYEASDTFLAAAIIRSHAADQDEDRPAIFHKFIDDYPRIRDRFASWVREQAVIHGVPHEKEVDLENTLVKFLQCDRSKAGRCFY